MKVDSVSTGVVYYSIPTSNHNVWVTSRTGQFVVYYSIPTSNHNCNVIIIPSFLLYIIPFLHQTTTECSISDNFGKLYIIPFLHQTTTACMKSKFQLELYIIPFLHQTTTSNRSVRDVTQLYIIPFLHQTTTQGFYIDTRKGCILFHSYIKPQPRTVLYVTLPVVYYSIPTSNHN